MTAPIERDEALAAMRAGNPFPILSGKVRFSAEESSFWSKRAQQLKELNDILDSGGANLSLVAEVRNLCQAQSEYDLPELAEILYTKIALGCRRFNAESYEKFLRDLGADNPGQEFTAQKIVDAVLTEERSITATLDQVERHLDELSRLRKQDSP